MTSVNRERKDIHAFQKERMMILFPVFFLFCFRKKRGKDFPPLFP